MDPGHRNASGNGRYDNGRQKANTLQDQDMSHMSARIVQLLQFALKNILKTGIIVATYQHGNDSKT